MAGKPKYDRDAVIGAALAAFWQHGYEATSMGDLLAVTGLSKSSLYGAFGDKHHVFLACYDRYRAARAQELRTVLDGHPAPEGIRAFFEQIIADDSTTSHRFGCMTTNQAAERGARDDAVRARVAEDFRLLEDAFTEHLRAGQDAGSVPMTLDTAAAASALVTAFSGFQLTVRADLDRSRLRRALPFLMAPLTRGDRPGPHDRSIRPEARATPATVGASSVESDHDEKGIS